MIASLTGNITYHTLNTITLNVHDVGYLVYVPGTLISNLINTPSPTTTLYIHTHVREDQLALYGFQNYSDRDLFNKLISVSGIGPKLGLSILSQAPANHIIQAITTADIEFFTKISGIGKKGAQKIILELKNQLGSLTELDLSEPIHTKPDLIAALTSLGYSPDEALSLAKHVPDDITDLQLQLKTALKKQI